MNDLFYLRERSVATGKDEEIGECTSKRVSPTSRLGHYGQQFGKNEVCTRKSKADLEHDEPTRLFLEGEYFENSGGDQLG